MTTALNTLGRGPGGVPSPQPSLWEAAGQVRQAVGRPRRVRRLRLPSLLNQTYWPCAAARERTPFSVRPCKIGQPTSEDTLPVASWESLYRQVGAGGCRGCGQPVHSPPDWLASGPSLSVCQSGSVCFLSAPFIWRGGGSPSCEDHLGMCVRPLSLPFGETGVVGVGPHSSAPPWVGVGSPPCPLSGIYISNYFI